MTRKVIAHGQGGAITPVEVEVEIVWENDLDVYYRIKGESLIKQTPRERFYEIVEA